MELALRMELTAHPGREETLDQGKELEAFLRGVEARAYRIATLAVRDADEALDLVQEAMIRLATRYGERPSDQWRPLFYRILGNLTKDWHRRRAVRARIVSFFGGVESDAPDPVVSAPGPREDDPVEALMERESMAALAEALRRLPDRQREAFVLRVFEGLDVAETATAMGCGEGSVKTHHSRAVARLRELLGESW